MEVLRRGPPERGHRMQRGIKIVIFDQYLARPISQKRYEIQTSFQWTTDRDLHMPYSRVISNDVE